eukprot:TRINITY_DN15778_c0_g1_i1.p1 TRINITY_DN15778_c0_g1~~TRINITY_DN15778_c0_g1_i1.p1  ORF type:complete len:369 (-),score=37.58 TRINITY_DN15778_c0_g1_i1:96-1202(-)
MDTEEVDQNIEGTEPNQNTEQSPEETARDTFYEYFGTFTDQQAPLIYSSAYNITCLGLERLHPFDSCKYENVINRLQSQGCVHQSKLIKPQHKPTREHLLTVHTEEYLDSLRDPKMVAKITEVAIVAAFPVSIVQWRVLDPFLYATSGTILAAHVAIQRGWAINVGGGFHHCFATAGGGFCAYADISLSIKFVRDYYSNIKKVMIIDLDAHQGNGHEREKLRTRDDDLFIVDMFNPFIYPHDDDARKAINVEIHARSGIEDEKYLRKLNAGLDRAFSQCTPDLIIYNAGTDILDGDQLGLLRVTPEGVMKRDAEVFKRAFELKIPIVMLLSGGYQTSNAQVIASSIANLDQQYRLISEESKTGSCSLQ